MAQLRYEELHPEFGVRIRGVDVSRPLADDLVAEINAAIDRYSFVCFPDQTMDDDRQLALTRQLGAFQLTMLGIGAIIGTGIFVLTAEAGPKAGPAMMLAFVFGLGALGLWLLKKGVGLRS